MAHLQLLLNFTIQTKNRKMFENELLINFKTVSINNYTNKEILMKKYVF